MIAAAAAFDGKFLRQTQAGEGFSRIHDLGLGAGNRIRVLPCLGCHAGEQLQKVEPRPLASKQCAGRPFDFAQNLVGNDAITVSGFPVNRDGGVELREAAFEPCRTAQHRVFARDNRGAGKDIGGNQLRGEIAATDILGQRRSDVTLDFSIEWV